CIHPCHALCVARVYVAEICLQHLFKIDCHESGPFLYVRDIGSRRTPAALVHHRLNAATTIFPRRPRRIHPYLTNRPPSTASHSPVMWRASLLARNSAAFTISDTSAILLSGVIDAAQPRSASPLEPICLPRSSNLALNVGVSVPPGNTALARTLLLNRNGATASIRDRGNGLLSSTQIY